MLIFIYRIVMFLICMALLSYSSFGLAANGAGLGGVAGNLIEPVSMLANFVGTAAIVIGATCLFAAFIKYTQHRVNPVAVPISVVVVLFIVGLLLLLLPFAYKLTEGGVPYGLNNTQQTRVQ